ncbi:MULTISPECIES: FAD-binding oxidoreductase [unclassified Haladaptatus]|uniref:NAD(P)/FAD-dependent oxidoreductase n=1 Tax=unclassified Haladaptatus TaxID=2622732 RepID=UPI0023E78DAF|nr:MULTISPECIES: FAD-dependent oxidoreductase [unclassified Haladaptatus]
MDPIVIVGGGIVGASVAYHLRDAARPVVLFEQNSVGSGASGDSVAIFVWHQSEPDQSNHRLRELAWETYEPLVRDGTFSFEQIGTFDVAFTEETATALEAAATTLDSYGARAECIPPSSLADHGVEPTGITGALHTPDDGYMDPSEIIHYFLGEATAKNLTVETKTKVTDVRTSDRGVEGVETASEFQPAAAVVNAAGPWAPTVNRMAEVSLPLRHNRGPIAVLQKDEQFSLPFVQFEDGLYLRGEGDRQAFAGRFGASYEAASELRPDEAHPIDHEFYLDIQTRIKESIPALADAQLVNEWVGIRTLTPDGVPLVGESSVPDFYVACGMNGLGVTLAPAVGEVLAAQLTDSSVDASLKAYLDPARPEATQ